MNIGEKMEVLFGVKEEWKDIKGFEGKYQISNFGDVKNLKTGKLLEQSPTHQGYMKVNLLKDNENDTRYIHRLVGEHFIPRIEGKDQIDHTDGNKRNNTIFNLGWVSQAENHLLRANLIKAVHLKTGEEKIFLGMGQAARELGLHKSKIHLVLKGERKHTGGYVFKNMTGYVN